MNSLFDVIVVGAGPAGATAARHCAQKGLRTLILEKELLPRYKSCGGGVTRGALGLMDFELTDDIIEGECFTVQVRYGRHRANITRPERQVIFTDRAKFDAFLTRKAMEAGAELHEARQVDSVEVLESHARVRCGSDSYCARLVIGADGAHSVVARNVRPPFGRGQIGVACDVRLGNDELDFQDRSVAVLDFGALRYGYAWIFPRREYLGVGIGAVATELLSHKEKLLSVLRNWGVKRTNIDAHWHVLPAGGYRRKTYADRILLVGDAAGFVDPLFGGGIELSFRSAIFAAQTAQLAMETGNCGEMILKKYADQCEMTFEKSLRAMLRLARILHRYPGLLIRPFSMSTRLTELVFGNITS